MTESLKKRFPIVFLNLFGPNGGGRSTVQVSLGFKKYGMVLSICPFRGDRRGHMNRWGPSEYHRHPDHLVHVQKN